MEVGRRYRMCALGDDPRKFGTQLVGMLQTAKVGPGAVETPRHAADTGSKRSRITNVGREIQIAPECGRQRFNVDIVEVWGA